MQVAVLETAEGGGLAETIATVAGDHFVSFARYHDAEPRRSAPSDIKALSKTGLAALLANARSMPATAPAAAGEANRIDDARIMAPMLERARVLLAGSRRFADPPNIEGPLAAMVKFRSAFADPGAEIELPDVSDRWDVDAVIGVVVGAPAFKIGANEAHRHIAGYTLMADVTDRARFEVESQTNNGLMAKNHRALSALGPVIWLPEDTDRAPGVVELRINGVLKQRFSLSDLAWRTNEVIAAWSVCPLLPGDILGLGPAILRSGAQDLPPAPLARGDTIAIDCAEIGGLRLKARA